MEILPHSQKLWSIFGANEQWSLWSTAHLKDCSLVENMSSRFSRTIYVGNLPSDIRESEIEDLFYKYGRIMEIELKVPPRPPCYCFVEFDNARDAEDAIRGRDGYNFDGCRLRDHMRKAGDVCFAEVSRDSEGTFGLVDYTNYDDMKYAIRKLDDTEFRNPWARSYIRSHVAHDA
ncbi:hypothetical protein TSUD_302290 [Trifolium subterraneum]|uniref:RRM domain-containing protein n=1 Tax=Trifolium subterraneum TaxID=3900 RepID=A0A2Z6NIS3_TRISU|nr:hypothetical protein TSUD_302290 [Trifolium subterraneum]